jgi:hypothetical protein
VDRRVDKLRKEINLQEQDDRDFETIIFGLVKDRIKWVNEQKVCPYCYQLGRELDGTKSHDIVCIITFTMHFFEVHVDARTKR